MWLVMKKRPSSAFRVIRRGRRNPLSISVSLNLTVAKEHLKGPKAVDHFVQLLIQRIFPYAYSKHHYKAVDLQ